MAITEEKQQILDTGAARSALSKAYFRLADHWGLTNEQTARLLGWSYANKRTKIDNMREGRMPLPQDQDKLERVQDLINIHKSLRVLFPNQRNLVYAWVKVPRERFGGHSALDVMLEDGKFGIRAIRRYLDYERTH